MTKRVITIEVEVPGGDPDFTHFALTANPYDVVAYGDVMQDEVVHEQDPLPEV